MEKHKFIVNYQYTIVGEAEVWAATLEEAIEVVQSDAPCPEPYNIHKLDYTDEIHAVEFSYLDGSCEVHED